MNLTFLVALKNARYCFCILLGALLLLLNIQSTSASPECENFSHMSRQGIAREKALDAMEEWALYLKNVESDATHLEVMTDRQIAIALDGIVQVGTSAIDVVRNSVVVTTNPQVRESYRVIVEAMTRLTELYSVGAKLFTARESNNIDLLVGLGSSLITDEAKHLTTPILSRIDLELRINEFLQTVSDREMGIRHRLADAMRRLPLSRIVSCY